MFKNLDNDIDIEVGHMCSGRTFIEVSLENLYKQDHEPLLPEEGFCSGEEEEILSEE
jgi:hypothetical protein